MQIQLQHPVELGGASSPRRLTPRCCWFGELTAGSVFGNFLATHKALTVQTLHYLNFVCFYCIPSYTVLFAYTRWGIISGTSVSFCHNSGNYCPNLMILSALWTEIICIQAQTKICHRTLMTLLQYLAKPKRSVCNYRTLWLLSYTLSTNSQKLITFCRNI